MVREKETLNITELLEVANALQAKLPGLEDAEPIKRLTFRYWVQQRLIPRRISRGTGARYPASFAERVVFIRMLQKHEALSLRDIRTVLEEAHSETIHRVAHGEEALELARYASDEEIDERENKGEQVLSLSASHRNLDLPVSTTDEARYLMERLHAQISAASMTLGTNSNEIWKEQDKLQRLLVEGYARIERKQEETHSLLRKIHENLVQVTEASA